MKDTSKRRLWTGRAAIFLAAAIALPLTATVVPVFAESDAPVVEKHKTKIVIMKRGKGDVQTIKLGGDADAPFVKTIEKDGKTIVLHSTHELSEAEVEQMVADAEASRAQADADIGQAEADRGQAQADRGEAEAARGEAEAARGEAEAARAHAMAIVRNMEVASYIPDIDISEITKNCEAGQPVTTNVTGFDGKNKSRVRIVMCGKGQAKVAKAQAVQGLREARDEIANDKDIPEATRKSILGGLENQINRMQKEADE